MASQTFSNLYGVTSGAFGASQVLISLQFILWKMLAWTVLAFFQVPNIKDAHDESGNATDKASSDSMAATFINELFSALKQKRMTD